MSPTGHKSGDKCPEGVARDLILARRNAGLTQAHLARAANVRQETISRLESGLHTITQATMKKLWRILKKRGGLSDL